MCEACLQEEIHDVDMRSVSILRDVSYITIRK